MALVLTTQANPGTADWVEGGTIDQITDPGDAGAIPVTESGSVALSTGGAETRTVGAPTFAGQTLAFFMQVDGGDCAITFGTALNVTGNTVATFANVRETLIVMAVVSTAAGALVWRPIHLDGPVLS